MPLHCLEKIFRFLCNFSYLEELTGKIQIWNICLGKAREMKYFFVVYHHQRRWFNALRQHYVEWKSRFSSQFSVLSFLKPFSLQIKTDFMTTFDCFQIDFSGFGYQSIPAPKPVGWLTSSFYFNPCFGSKIPDNKISFSFSSQTVKVVTADKIKNLVKSFSMTIELRPGWNGVVVGFNSVYRTINSDEQNKISFFFLQYVSCVSARLRYEHECLSVWVSYKCRDYDFSYFLFSTLIKREFSFSASTVSFWLLFRIFNVPSMM